MKAIGLVLLFAWFSPAFGAGGGSLSFPSNLQHGQAPAVVVLFSLPDCAYCEKVRQQSLRHIHTDPVYKGRVFVYEIDFPTANAVLSGLTATNTLASPWLDR